MNSVIQNTSNHGVTMPQKIFLNSAGNGPAWRNESNMFSETRN